MSTFTAKLCVFILVICLTVCLAGCASRSPAEPLENTFEGSVDFGSQYAMNNDWWVIYQDAQLNRLMQTALQNNPDLIKAAIGINKALYQAKLLGADLVPAFSGSGTASSTKNTSSGASARNFIAEGTVNYELDLWRRLADKVSAQEWEHKATMEDKAAVRLALINTVIDTYFTLSYLDKALAATAESVNNYEKLLQLVTAKYRLGRVDRLEPEQAAQALLATKNSLIDLEVQQKTAMQTLRLLLNIAPTAALALTFPDIVQVKTSEIALNIPLAALAIRPDLKAAEYRLQKAFKDHRAATKAWYPSVSVGGSLSASSESHNTVFDVPFAAGAIKINLPFLDWNRVYWNVKISEAEYDLLKVDFEEKITTALNEVDAAIFFYRKARATYANTAAKHEHDVTISGYYKKRYEFGVSELSDWINAQNTALASRLDLLKNRHETITSESAVYKALGGAVTLKSTKGVPGAPHKSL